MLRIVKGFAPWILFDCFEEKFYIHWSAGRSLRVHEVNPGRDPSVKDSKWFYLDYIALIDIVLSQNNYFCGSPCIITLWRFKVKRICCFLSYLGETT